MLYEQFIKWIGYQINDDTSLLFKHTLQEKNIMEFNLANLPKIIEYPVWKSSKFWYLKFILICYHYMEFNFSKFTISQNSEI